MINPSCTSHPLGRLAEEFIDRRRRGERPTVEEFAERNPELAGSIHAFFPALLMTEDLRPELWNATGSFPGAAAPGQGPPPGRLGDYRVIREVGRGGMGVVYEAEQESLGRRVALKVLAPSALLDPRQVARFDREARSAARLHHTNIVPVFGVGEASGVHYYAMQFIAGAGLDRVLDELRRLRAASAEPGGPGRPRSLAVARSLVEGPASPAEGPEDGAVASPSAIASAPSVFSAASEPGRAYARLVAEIGVQVAEALQYAHEQGTLHRDIKPSNLLLDAHGTAWVTDFGLAKAIADDDLTHTGDLVGTLRYMAPERFHGCCDARSDIYGLGLTLYELLARRPAFDATDRTALMRQVGQVDPPRLRKVDSTIPRDLETIVHKAIEKAPAHRYPTAGALAADLRCLLEDRPIRSRRTTSIERAWRWGRRNRATASLAAVAAAAVVAAAVVGWAGYVSTTRALEGESWRRALAEEATRRAEENLAVSLAVFDELFHGLAPTDNVPTPMLGLSVGEILMRAGPDGLPQVREQRTSPSDASRLPNGSRQPGGPGTDPALLGTLLSYYERLSARNATTPRLRAEAAWAYRKVGALYERLGHLAESKAAYLHAVAIFEDLIARYPDEPEYRFKLVDTFDIADPWSAEPAALGPLLERLERARDLVDELANAYPNLLDYAHARSHIHAKLGKTLQRLGRGGEAEAAYRRAITLEGAALESWPHDGRTMYDRATTHEALATLLLDRGQEAEALGLLTLAVEEMQALATEDRTRRPPPHLFRRLAADFRRLGDTARAEAMSRMAEWARGSPSPASPDRAPGPRVQPEGPIRTLPGD